MSTNSITIKPNNHRIHPVPSEKKAQLLAFLLEQNPTLTSLVCISDKSLIPQEIQDNNALTLVEDKDIASIADASYTFVISYDLCEDPQLYIQRVSKASQKAVLLLDTQEQNKLYPLETLLKRTIKQEPVEGFTEMPKVAPKKEYKAKDDTKKEKKPNKYLGKDANGKAIFSGKSGERNHRYDGTPRDKNTSTKLTGKTINVKAKKKD
jgi:hypothetical protein